MASLFISFIVVIEWQEFNWVPLTKQAAFTSPGALRCSCINFVCLKYGHIKNERHHVINSNTPCFAGVREFCETEAFNATCDHDEVILMKHARYGRMRVGRCVKLDYGHVGCASDVLGLADTRCSGRRICQIRIPDALFAKTKPCPDDLKPYMEATYDCVKGNSNNWSLVVT